MFEFEIPTLAEVADMPRVMERPVLTEPLWSDMIGPDPFRTAASVVAPF